MRVARHKVVDISGLDSNRRHPHQRSSCSYGREEEEEEEEEERAEISRQVLEGMREDGFVCVSVGEDAGKLTREALEATRDFHALTREEKERVHHSTGAPGDKVGGYFRKGEEPFYENEKKGSEGVDASHVEDFCVHLDMLNGGARDNQIWPRSPVNFKPLLLKFCREMVRIGSSLHRALAKGLQLPPHFDFRQSPSLMRLLRYPPKPKHGNITAHTDYEVGNCWFGIERERERDVFFLLSLLLELTDCKHSSSSFLSFRQGVHTHTSGRKRPASVSERGVVLGTNARKQRQLEGIQQLHYDAK